MHTQIRIAQACLTAVGLMVMAAANAATTPVALNGQVTLRPLTPQDLKDYKLTNNVQGASGMSAVGIGQPAYLEALADSRIAPESITNVTWTLVSQPLGSTATLQAGPLGTNVPLFSMRDRLDRQLVGRQMLRPDVAGQYVVSVSIMSATNGSTTVTQKLTGGTYMGLMTCMLCHSGGTIAQNIAATYTNTPHASMFIQGITGVKSDHYGKNCISCHTVGYDANTNAANGGFDDVALQLGWTFPNNITNLAAAATNWAALPSALKNLANIQCENCHGPGSEHAAALGNTNLANWPRIDEEFSIGNCAVCHDSKNNHSKVAEWKNSRHAISTRSPSGAGREACVRCHTAIGFKSFITTGNQLNSNTTYEAITCSACHDPHDATNPKQLRVAPIYTLPEGTTVTNAGLGALCMQCHHSRNGSASNNVAAFTANLPSWAGGVGFGPHDSTAGDMVEGVNGIEYGKVIPSGSHSVTVSNVCVGCHMQPVASSDPAFTLAGGHTFSMTYPVVTNGVTNVVAKTTVCAQCHGPLEDFNMVRKDYDGDGTIDGIQTEIQHLLDKLSTLLPNANYLSNGNYVADGLVKTIGRTTVKTNWQTKFLNGAWNYMFVNVEGSHGIHNAPYAVGLLKASIADLTDDSNNDGLPDTWQIANFGSVTNKSAAPNATPANDGVPNWLKYSLGLNPTIAGIVVPDGVIWAGANGTALINPPGTNTVLKVYTAAEVAFDTVVGKTYQIQAVSSLGAGWQNIGAPIPGTGSPVSYVTPLRSKVQQFYRVIVNP